MYDILNRIRLIISNVGLNTFVDVGIVYYVLYRGYLLIRDMRAKQLVKGIVLCSVDGSSDKCDLFYGRI
jgi:DNA integrity scanning protein DisA with diadenylate cyclase activity